MPSTTGYIHTASSQIQRNILRPRCQTLFRTRTIHRLCFESTLLKAVSELLISKVFAASNVSWDCSPTGHRCRVHPRYELPSTQVSSITESICYSPTGIPSEPSFNVKSFSKPTRTALRTHWTILKHAGNCSCITKEQLTERGQMWIAQSTPWTEGPTETSSVGIGKAMNLFVLLGTEWRPERAGEGPEEICVRTKMFKNAFA